MPALMNSLNSFFLIMQECGVMEGSDGFTSAENGNDSHPTTAQEGGTHLARNVTESKVDLGIVSQKSQTEVHS